MAKHGGAVNETGVCILNSMKLADHTGDYYSNQVYS